MKHTFLFAMLTALLFLAPSCKKKDKNNTCAISEANFTGSYKIESVKYKASSSSPEVDGTTYLESCELDDVTTFNADHTYVYTDAGTTCDPDGNDSGTWSLSGSTITIEGESENLENFSCSGFSISDSPGFISGDKITVTFKKQ